MLFLLTDGRGNDALDPRSGSDSSPVRGGAAEEKGVSPFSTHTNSSRRRQDDRGGLAPGPAGRRIAPLEYRFDAPWPRAENQLPEGCRGGVKDKKKRATGLELREKEQKAAAQRE
ncbi:hypothetical protein MRX96_021336 [Rhipicephalus microplus]